MSWEVAAALPVAANTAYQALTDIGLKPGETLVVDGAAGGVGTVPCNSPGISAPP
ncbi:hypothetical protein ACFC08_37150 [Streptomyces sp. NPDC056112]|uniref:hypothetical protein n=1 Tax=Streptomyces sp. NPDC056112 TaxID=3345715 RepID=UPI0035E0632F